MKFKPFVCLLLIITSCNNPSADGKSEKEMMAALKEQNESIILSFDSLMKIEVQIPQKIDSAYMSVACAQGFNDLALATGGQMKAVLNSKLVTTAIMTILKQQLEPGTDVMLVLDKTSSMEDDIGSIRKGIKNILQVLSKQEHTRLAVMAYGDKHADGNGWYDYQNFESDFSKTESYINQIQLTGGGDAPESVYDALYEAFHAGFWKSENKRLVILLGDAPSLDGELSAHHLPEIVELSKAHQIHVNFYPIVLSPYPTDESPDAAPKMEPKHFIDEMYPNPSSGLVSILLNQEKGLSLELFDQSGKLLVNEKLIGNAVKKELYEYPNGLYIVRISDEANNYETRKLILNK